MTIKVALLKSGEHIITDIKEMVSGSEENGDLKVLGYFFEFPYVVHLRNPELVMDKVDKNSPLQLEISLFTWMPLSKDHIVPVPTDWVVTLVEPVKKLNDMYTTLINRIKAADKNEPTNDQVNPTDQQSDLGFTD
jgi:hypothetical protein